MQSTALHRVTNEVLLGISLVMAVSAPLARAAENGTSPSDGASRTRSLEEVVVTARRRIESVQDVPAAVTALDRDALERYGATDLVSVSQITPQLTLNAAGSNSGAVLYLRGIGSGSNLGFDQTVGVVIDDVFYNRGRWIQQSFMDMERVEVLKGPQALYFGKNTPAGVVIVTTAEPGARNYVRAGLETEAEEWIVEGAFDVALSESFAARFALQYRDMRGWMKNAAGVQSGVDPLGLVIPAPHNDHNESEQVTGRVTLRWTPSSRFDATVKVQATELEDAGQNTMTQKLGCQGPGNTPQPVFGVFDPFDDCSRDLTISKADAPPEMAVNAPFDFNGGVPFTDYESWNASLRLNYSAGDFDLTSVTGFNDYENRSMDNQDYSAAGQVWAGEIEAHESFSQEVRFASSLDGPLNYIVGAYYQKTDFDYRIQADIAPLPPDPVTGTLFSWDRPSRQDGRTWSAFAGFEWDITPNLELAGGARYSDERKESATQHAFVHAALAPAFASRKYADVFEDDNLSPEVTLTWQPADQLTVYGAFKTGFKAGGFSHTAVLLATTSLDELTFDSEEVAGFEVGAKARLLNDALAVNAAIYQYDFEDQQVTVFNPQTTSFTIQNAGETRTRGFEFEGTYLAAEGLELRAAIAYNRARYRNFIGSCFAGQTREEGCNEAINPLTGLPTSQDLRGKRPVLAPDWNLSAGFTYERQLNRALTLEFSGDVRYSSRYPLVVESRPDLFQSDYTTFDAALRLYYGPRWELSLIGRNLTNEVILLNGGGRPLTGGPAGLPADDPLAGVRADAFAVTQRPRQVQLQATYQF